jgi:hypothetical protein
MKLPLSAKATNSSVFAELPIDEANTANVRTAATINFLKCFLKICIWQAPFAYEGLSVTRIQGDEAGR